MALKSNITSSYKNKAAVGEKYSDRWEHAKRQQQIPQAPDSFLSKVGSKFKQMLFGPELFEAKAEYVGGAKTLAQYHRDVEMGVRKSSKPSDSDLMRIINTAKTRNK